MGTLWRKMKAAMTIGTAWGFAWFGAGAAMWLAGARADVPFPVAFGMMGFLTGTAFSGVLMVAERGGKRLLSLPRFAGWGALGGLVFSAIFGGTIYLVEGVLAPLLVTAVVFPVAGAICASGTLALARMGERRELLDAGHDVDIDAIGLSADEERQLLG
jgi:hypothetical protein